MDKQVMVTDFLEEFVVALREQLDEDYERWGDTWLNRTRDGQEARVVNDIVDYYDQFVYVGKPMPWLKVIGNALIAWIRDQHPELFPA